MKKSKSLALILIICFSFLFIATGIFLLYAFVFPYKLAHDMYDLGFNTYAVKLYDRAYTKDKTNVDALYMALNISIKLDDSADVEKYFEEFSSNPNYFTYVEAIDETNYVKETTVLVKSTLLSEDNYLKNRYVDALIKQEKWDEAIKFSNNSIIANPSVDNTGNYYYANFMKDTISSDNLEFFVDNNIVDDMHKYILSLHADFKDTFKLDKLPERVSAGNRVITVSYNLLYLNTRFENQLLTEEEVSDISAIIDTTKSAINVLIME